MLFFYLMSRYIQQFYFTIFCATSYHSCCLSVLLYDKLSCPPIHLSLFTVSPQLFIFCYNPCPPPSPVPSLTLKNDVPDFPSTYLTFQCFTCTTWRFVAFHLHYLALPLAAFFSSVILLYSVISSLSGNYLTA